NTGLAHLVSTRALYPFQTTLPVNGGADIPFGLSPGAVHAGQTYVLLAGLGTTGFSIGGLHVPIDLDVLAQLSLNGSFSGVFVNFFGTLDQVTGQAHDVHLNALAQIPAQAIGIPLYFGYAVKGVAASVAPQPGATWLFASPPETITITP